MNHKEKLIEVFRDTQNMIADSDYLKQSVQSSIEASTVFDFYEYPVIDQDKSRLGLVTVTGERTIAAAMRLSETAPASRIAVLNFASAIHPGGGVQTGSSAQEESLCRCTTLYPVISHPTFKDSFYVKPKNDLYRDTLIYSPGICVCKSDVVYPTRLTDSEYFKVDVITCAAPNLRKMSISDKELYYTHVTRAEHILHVAAHYHVDSLILGAFGCGAFKNRPYPVARAFKEALLDYRQYFDNVVFAVYCREKDKENYETFKRVLQ